MRNPVVVIPGYYGSKLTNTVSNSLVWLDGQGLLHPELTANAIRLDPGDPNRVASSGILDEVVIFPPLWEADVYKSLIDFLRSNLGYGSGELFQFHYDWRKSLEHSAAKLADQIDRWLTQSGANQVDVVAHSLGGLVVRAYLKRFDAADKIGWLITLGTPHKGMLKTFQALYNGIKAFTLSAAQTKAVSRGFPSAYELLPTDPADRLFLAGGDPSRPFADPSWCETADMRAFLDQAESAVDDLLDGALPVDSCLVYGTRRETTESSQDSGGGTLGFSTGDDGDGTVPRVSAMGRALAAGPGKSLLRFPVPQGIHSALFKDSFVQQQLLTPLLLRRPRKPLLLAASFRYAPIFQPRTDNLFVAEVLDSDGHQVQRAQVRLTLEGTTIRDRNVPRSAQRGDFVLKVRMPGPGTATRYRVRADVDGAPEPLLADGLLVSTSS